MPDTLAQKVRAKFPGVYDDLSDQDLEAKVIAKYPGVYDDIPKTSGEPSPDFTGENEKDAAGEATVAPGILGTLKDVASGARAGFANTVYGGGDLIRRATGMDRIIDEPDVKAAMTPPESTAGKVGFAGEQLAEFFIPAGGVGKAAKVAEVVKAGALTAAQTGSAPAAATSAVLTAAIPGAGALASKASPALRESARKSMAQALGATKEWAKVEAQKLAPEMLKRGIGGSRQAMLATAKEATKRVGGQLDDAYRLAAEAGDAVPSEIITGNIQLAADALKVRDAKGALRVVPGTERAVQKLDELAEFVTSMGDEIPVDKAAALKRAWDRIVSKAGLFGPKALSSATDNADAYAYREASGAFRELLNTNPTIEALNKETAFWIGLKNVLKETEKRTQAQRGSITDAIRGGYGAAAGAMSGGPVGALFGSVATQQLSKVLASPWWRTKAAGPAKLALGNALASGNPGAVASVAGRIASSLPAQLTQRVTP